MSRVFISYSRRDADPVRRLHGALSSAGREPWIDWDDIPPTAEWMQEVYAAIDAADDFVFAISPESIASEICQLELDYALRNSKRLIPVVVEEIPPSAVPEEVRSLNWIFCREQDDFDSVVSSIFEAIDTDLEWVRSHTRILVRAREWEKHDAEESYLLRGSDLKQAVGWLTTSGPRKQPTPTDLHSRYVQASQEAESQELARVTQLYEQALGRQLAAQSSNIVRESSDLLERGVLLAVESIRRYPTAEATQVLRELVPLLPRRLAHWSVTPTPEVVEFSPDGRRVLTAAGRLSEKEVEFSKSMEDFVSMEEMEESTARANALEEDPSYGVARVWDASSGRELAHFLHDAAVLAAVFSRDGRRVATLSGGKARLWDLETLEQTRGSAPKKLRQDEDERLRDRHAFLRPRLVKALDRLSREEIDEELRRRAVESRERWGKPRVLGALIDDLFLEAVDLTNDGRYWFEEREESFGFSMRATRDGREISRVPPGYGTFAIHPTEPRIAAAGEGSVDVWEMAGEWTALVLESEMRVERMRFSPDGSLLATGGDWDREPQVWDLESATPLPDGRRRKQMSRALGKPASARADDKHVCRGVRTRVSWESYDEEVRVRVGSKGGQELKLESDGEIDDVRLGTNDELLLVRGSSLRVWALPAGRLIGTFDLSDYALLSTATFSPDGTMVAAGDYAGNVGVWRLESGEEIARFVHEDDVRDALFSTDDSYLITASKDKTARVWDLRKGTEAGRLPHEEEVQELLLSPDESILATLTDTGEASVWRWRPDDLATLALDRLTRGLNEDEWNQYLGGEPYPGGDLESREPRPAS